MKIYESFEPADCAERRDASPALASSDFLYRDILSANHFVRLG